MRIGIYAGTFDPVHDGHVAFSLAAIEALQLDAVIFLPEQSPRAKTDVSRFKHRFHMLQLVTADYGKLQVLEAPMPQFTVDSTLPWLRHTFKNDELTLLIGSDTVPDVARWPHVNTLLLAMPLAIGVRAGDDGVSVRKHLAALPAARFTCITTSQPHMAATDVRKGFSQAIHPSVAHYIRVHNLYADAQGIMKV